MRIFVPNYRKSQKFRSGQIVGQSFATNDKNSAQPSLFSEAKISITTQETSTMFRYDPVLSEPTSAISLHE